VTTPNYWLMSPVTHLSVKRLRISRRSPNWTQTGSGRVVSLFTIRELSGGVTNREILRTRFKMIKVLSLLLLFNESLKFSNLELGRNWLLVSPRLSVHKADIVGKI